MMPVSEPSTRFSPTLWFGLKSLERQFIRIRLIGDKTANGCDASPSQMGQFEKVS
jgi:hypothetical protein